MDRSGGARISAYIGPNEYAFVSYAHADVELIFDDLAWLQERGLHLWFDEGINPGTTWRDEIADRIADCNLFIFYVSARSVASQNCIKEANYALDLGKPVLIIYLDDAELPGGLKMYVNDRQAIEKYTLERDAYHEKLLAGATNPLPWFHVQQKRTWRVRRGWFGVGIAIVVVGIAVVLLNSFEPDVALPQKPKSIAVLKFDGVEDDQAFVNGFSQSLLNVFARISELTVRSRVSSWAIDSSLDARQAASRLDVSYILEGTVATIADRLTINAYLVDGQSGQILWTGQFAEPSHAEAYYAILDNITDNVVAQLGVTLSIASESARRGGRTTEMDALTAHQAGRDLLLEPFSHATTDRALDLFSRSVAIDDGYAEAYAGRCSVYLAKFTATRDTGYFQEAEPECLRALGLDPYAGEVLASLGSLHRYAGRGNEALIQLERAQNLLPHWSWIHEEKGRVLRQLGRVEEAEATFREAIRTEPGNWSVYKSMGNFLLRTGRNNEARSFYEQALTIDPENKLVQGNLGAALFNLGEFEAAVQTWEPLLDDHPTHLVLVNYANALFQQHRFADAVVGYESALQRAPADPRLLGGLAASREHAGDVDGAMADYDKAIQAARAYLDVNPEDQIAIAILGHFYARVGETALARETIGRASNATLTDPQAHFYRALTFQNLNDRDEALASVRAAIEHGMSEAIIATDPDLSQLSGIQDIIDDTGTN